MKKQPRTYWEVLKSKGLFIYYLKVSIFTFIFFGSYQAIVEYKQNEGFALSAFSLKVILISSILNPFLWMALHKWYHNKYISTLNDRKEADE